MMFTIAELTEFFGWSTLINCAMFLLATVAVIGFRDTVASIHSKLFGIDPTQLPAAYFRYLANYKITIIVFNLAPYIALKIMS